MPLDLVELHNKLLYTDFPVSFSLAFAQTFKLQYLLSNLSWWGKVWKKLGFGFFFSSFGLLLFSFSFFFSFSSFFFLFISFFLFFFFLFSSFYSLRLQLISGRRHKPWSGCTCIKNEGADFVMPSGRPIPL